MRKAGSDSPPRRSAPPQTHVLPSPPLVTLALPHRNPISHTPRERARRTHPDKGRRSQEAPVCVRPAQCPARRRSGRSAAGAWGTRRQPRPPGRPPQPARQAPPHPAGASIPQPTPADALDGSPPQPGSAALRRGQRLTLGPLPRACPRTGLAGGPAPRSPDLLSPRPPELIYWRFIWRSAIALRFRGKERSRWTLTSGSNRSALFSEALPAAPRRAGAGEARPECGWTASPLPGLAPPPPPGPALAFLCAGSHGSLQTYF